MAWPPLRAELGAEAVQTLELEQTIEPEQYGTPEALPPRVRAKHQPEPREVQRQLRRSARVRPPERPDDQELHQPVRRVAFAPRGRQRPPAGRRRGHQLQEAAEAALLVLCKREHRLGREQAVEGHREATLA